MKITKHGKHFNQRKIVKGKCDACGCEISCTRQEVKFVSDQRDGNYSYVNCPECSHIIYVPSLT